jgi:hypothetical protein
LQKAPEDTLPPSGTTLLTAFALFGTLYMNDYLFSTSFCYSHPFHRESTKKTMLIVNRLGKDFAYNYDETRCL